MLTSVRGLLSAFFFSFFVLIGCGGGGGDGTPTPPPVITYTISTNPGEGTSITPASMVVNAGQTAVFSVSLLPGYSNLTVTGAGGTLNNGVYTTGAINADVTITSTATSDLYSLMGATLTPNALFDTEFADTPITVEVSAQGKGVSLFVSIFKNGNVVEVPLLDSGANGDRVAGDNVYSATFTMGFNPVLQYYGGTVGKVRAWITARDASGELLTSTRLINPNIDLGVVSSAVAVPTTAVGPGVVAATHMVNVVIPAENENDGLRFGMKKVYEYYPDEFDAGIVHRIGFIPGNDNNIPGFTMVRNDVSGINIPMFDGSGNYGSNGVLASVASQALDITGNVILHEIGHRWGFFLGKPELNLTEGGVHVRSPSTLLGQMGSNLYLNEQNNGDFIVEIASDGGFTGRKYSNLELYLSGMLPPSSVGPERFTLGMDANYQLGDIVPRDKTTLVSIEDIVNVYGVRTPSSNSSQKTFRWVFIGLSKRPMTLAEFAIINRLATYYASHDEGGEKVKDHDGFITKSPPSFWSATKYQGSLITELPPKK